MIEGNGKVEGIPLTCSRCHHQWTYTGGKIQKALTADHPVFTSCPVCHSPNVRVIIPGAVYQPKIYQLKAKVSTSAPA